MLVWVFIHQPPWLLILQHGSQVCHARSPSLLSLNLLFILATGLLCRGSPVVGAVVETASMKRRKLWKTGEDGLCCSSSAIQTRLDPSSLLEERSETPIVFVCFFCVVGYPPNWGKRPRYIDRGILSEQMVFCVS